MGGHEKVVGQGEKRGHARGSRRHQRLVIAGPLKEQGSLHCCRLLVCVTRPVLGLACLQVNHWLLSHNNVWRVLQEDGTAAPLEAPQAVLEPVLVSGALCTAG